MCDTYGIILFAKRRNVAVLIHSDIGFDILYWISLCIGIELPEQFQLIRLFRFLTDYMAGSGIDIGTMNVGFNIAKLYMQYWSHTKTLEHGLTVVSFVHPKRTAIFGLGRSPSNTIDFCKWDFHIFRYVCRLFYISSPTLASKASASLGIVHIDWPLGLRFT